MKSFKNAFQTTLTTIEGRQTRAYRLAILVLLISMLCSFTFADVYHEETERQTLGKGIEYVKRLIFASDGWTQIHYYKVDLTQPEVGLKLLYNAENGLSTRKKLSSMVTPQTVGAVNGDYFGLITPSTTIGTAIDNGRLLATPSQHQGYSTLIIENQMARIFKDQLTLELIHNGTTRIPFEAYNRIHNQFYKVVVLDNGWGKRSFGVSKTYPDMMEIVLMNGVVQEIRDRMPAIDITEGMQVIIANGLNRNTFANVRVGDSMVMNVDMRLDPSLVTMGVGGGCRILQNGQPVPFLLDLSTRHPRTAVGTSDGGQTLYFATIDGRAQGYKGMNGNELVQLFQGLGCTDAMILDGGGSTTFFKRALGDTVGAVVNFLSDGTERMIVTGIGIENLGQSGVIQGIELSTPYKDRVAVGSSLPLIVKAYDEAYLPMTVDAAEVRYQVVVGKGTVRDGRFYPSAAGDVLVRATYLGKQAEILLTAYADIDRIAFESDKKEIKQSVDTTFKVYAYTSEGYALMLSPQDLQMSDTRSLGSFQGGSYRSDVAGETILEARFGGLTAQMDLWVGTDQVIYFEFENGGIQFSGSSPQAGFTANSDANAYSGNRAIGIDYQFSPDANNRAVYLTFDQSIVVESDIDRIGMYAYSLEQKPNMWIRLAAVDGAGQPQTLDFKRGIDWTGWRYIEAAVPTGTVYPLTIQKIYMVDVAPQTSDAGSISFDRLLGLKKKTFALYGGIQNKAYTDARRGVNATMGPLHAIVPGKTSGASLFDRMLLKQLDGKASGYERVFATSPVVGSGLESLKRFFGYFNGSYTKDLGDVTVVKFSNKLGGLRKTSATEWVALNALENTVKTPVLLMLLDENPFTTAGFYEPKELELFKKRLEAIALQGKDVVVVYEGSINGSRLENRVRYVSLKKLPKDLLADGKALSYIEWTVYQNKFYYDYRPLMTP